MNIGIINPFPFRPHNQDLVFLTNCIKRNKNINLFFAECDGSPALFYNKLINKKTPKIIICKACQLFGLKSYLNEPFEKISIKKISLLPSSGLYDNLALSSIFTAYRTESEADVLEARKSKDFLILKQESDKFKRAVKDWIKKNNFLLKNILIGLIIQNANIIMPT